MQARVEDGGVLFERVLGAVAVVDVPVEDQDLLEPVSALEVAGEDRDVVEQAEAEGEGALRVVAGRTGEAEPVMEVARHEAVGEGESRPGRDPRGVEGVPAHPDIGNVEERSAGSAHFFRSGDVLGSVHRFQPLGRAGLGRDRRELPEPRLAPEPVHGGGEARAPLGMAAARIVPEAGRVVHEAGAPENRARGARRAFRRLVSPGRVCAHAGLPAAAPPAAPAPVAPAPAPRRAAAPFGVTAAPTTRRPAACRGRRAPAGWG